VQSILSIADFMTAAATRYLRIRRVGSVWRFVVFIAALAFTLQTYVIQTHIDGGSQGFDSTSIVDILAKTPAHGKSPIDNSPLVCPFCQAIAHASAFFAPATPLLQLPVVWAECEAPSVIARAVAIATTHSWQSRAPPQR
jgi:hypothetical protein